MTNIDTVIYWHKYSYRQSRTHNYMEKHRCRQLLTQLHTIIQTKIDTCCRHLYTQISIQTERVAHKITNMDNHRCRHLLTQIVAHIIIQTKIPVDTCIDIYTPRYRLRCTNNYMDKNRYRYSYPVRQLFKGLCDFRQED